MKWILSMMAMATVGLSAYWATRGSGEAAPEAPAQVEAAPEPARGPARATSERDLSSVRQRLSDLSDEMTRLRSDLEKRPAAEKPAEVTAPPPLHTAEARAEQERQWHEHMAKVDEEFQGEPVESTWSTSTSATIRTAIQSREALKDTLRRIDCRSQTCRVEIVDDGAGKVQNELSILASDLGDTLPNVQAEHEDLGGGRLLMTLYLTRNVAPPNSTSSTGAPLAR